MNSQDKSRPSLNPGSEELAQLVSHAQKGSRQSLERLVERTRPMACRIAASILHRDQIEDAVQESYLLLVRKLCQLKNAKAFKAWFSRMVLHVCYQAQRSKRFTEELSETLPSHEQTERVVNALALRQALSRLPDKDRDILILRELLGLSYEELAYSLRVPVGTVRSRLSSARKRLKKCWAPKTKA